MVVIICSVVLAADLPVWLLLVSNRWKASRLGEIPVLKGFERDSVGEGSYAHFIRQLPIKKRGAWVHLFSGKLDRHLQLSTAVIDMQLLSNSEQFGAMRQCAHAADGRVSLESGSAQ